MVRCLLAFVVFMPWLLAHADGAVASDQASLAEMSTRTLASVADEKSDDEADGESTDDDAGDSEESGDSSSTDNGEKGSSKRGNKEGEKAGRDDSAEDDADEGSQDAANDDADDGDESKDDKPKGSADEAKPAKDADKSARQSAAEAKKPEETKPEEKKPQTHKVAVKDLKIEAESDAVFVAQEAEEVALRPEKWSSFQVLEAVPHGARVRKGDVLVKFDSTNIDEALAEKSLALRLGEIALLEAEEEFPRLEKAIELNYQQAERTYQQSVDEQDRFNKTMRDLSEKMAEYMLKSAEQDFANASEELKQLEKMYEADELTEETEEIVLKRQKFQVEAAKFYLEYSKINHDYTVNVSIPRRAESLQTAVDVSKIEFDRAKMAKSLGMNEQRYELQQLRETRKKALDDYADLEADRQLMTLKAPADGIAYYGRCVNGRWIEVSSLENKLIPFGSVSPNSVVMTVVKDRPLYVETSIGEKELPDVEKGQSATVVPAADGDVEIDGKVERVSAIPGAGNKFAVRIDVDGSDLPDWLAPGMTGKAKIVTYDVKDAVVIPADLVQSDENDPKSKYVMLQVEGKDNPVRREIKIGETKDKQVEVLEGLKEGDEIVKGAKDSSKDAESDRDKPSNDKPKSDGQRKVEDEQNAKSKND